MIPIRSDDKELNEKVESGEKVIKIVGGYTFPYIKHLKKHGIPHHKDKSAVVVLIDKKYRNFGGLVGLHEKHYILERNDVFNKQLLEVVNR